MPKRKSSQIEESEHDVELVLRRSSRKKVSGARSLPSDREREEKAKRPAKRRAMSCTAAIRKAKDVEDKKSDTITAASAAPGAVPKAAPEAERQYWLMKAEPETRLENGVDVKFSIDDLAAKTEPEPWDGIRNYVARNNLRAMKKGDLAFFYHSNCKEPGIVGTMEIVQEHSPDMSAHDPKTPYYDPKSKPSDPKWSVVHVKFRSKFAVPIGLKELKSMGKPLENMQMLKQSRLSVSRVSESEWEYLMGVAEEKAKNAKSEESKPAEAKPEKAT